ncbi:MAG: cobalamin-dependent protein [Spirochaetes bacterium]|nr:cobalamin-dependent protein [Spirochaetota bacterium]
MFTFTRYEPLEFEYLAASVPAHEVEILDMRIDTNLMKKLETFKPDVVGVTAYTTDVRTANRLLREIKNHNSHITTVVGGHHATFLPGDFSAGNTDAVFLGYGDRSFREYIDTLERGDDPYSVCNIGIVKNGDIRFTRRTQQDIDLDSLPVPARHLTRRYRHKYHDSYGFRTALVTTSRGCPYRCSFCACWKLMNGRYVTRDVRFVVEEIETIDDDVDYIDFSDDNTLHNIPRAWKLVEALKERNIEKKFKMYARTDLIVKNQKLFESLHEVGLNLVTVGFESIKDEQLRALNKMTSVEINNEAIRILKKLGIFVDAHFIVDPCFGEKDFLELFHYVNEKNLFRNTFAVLTPLPGTELFEQNIDRLAIKDYDYYDFGHSILPTVLDRKRFYRLFANLYRKAYSPARLIKWMIRNRDKRKTDNVDNTYRNSDGFTLLRLLVIYLLAVPSFFRMRNNHKTEPVVS